MFSISDTTRRSFFASFSEKQHHAVSLLDPKLEILYPQWFDNLNWANQHSVLWRQAACSNLVLQHVFGVTQEPSTPSWIRPKPLNASESINLLSFLFLSSSLFTCCADLKCHTCPAHLLHPVLEMIWTPSGANPLPTSLQFHLPCCNHCL